MLTKEQKDKLKQLSGDKKNKEKALMKSLNKIESVLSKYDDNLCLLIATETEEDTIKLPVKDANLDIKYFAEYNGRIFYLEEKVELIKWILVSEGEDIEKMSTLALKAKCRDAEKLIQWQRKIVMELK